MNNYTVILAGRWDIHIEYVAALNATEAEMLAKSKAGLDLGVIFITLGHHPNLANYK